MAVTAAARVGANVSNDTGSATVNWTVTCGGSDCGSFNPASTSSGAFTFYTAPASVPTGNTVVVTATLGSDSTKTASATVTITLAPSADFFVAPNGNDSNAGTFAAPFATIAHTQKAVQGILSGRTNSIVVMVRGGNTPYFLTQPLTFTSADSGTPLVNIFWQAYPGEAPMISGGMPVTNWTQNGSQWSAKLPAGAQYFEQLFYNGERRLRPRLGSPPVVGTYLRIAAAVFASSASTNCPDQGQTNGQFECYDRFQYTAGDPISTNWANLSPPPGNPCGAAGNAYPPGDIALYSFEQMGMSKMLIDCIDTASQIIYLTGPIRMRTTLSDTTTGFVANRRYLVENVKNLLSQPGQWFLDRSSTPWTVDYLPNSGENPSTDTVIVPQMPAATPQVLLATNLQNVTFQGLTFAHDNFTVPAAGNPYMRLDQTVTSAVSCQNCQNVIFDGDTITQTAGAGIDFTTTAANAISTNNAFQNGAIFDVASHGIRIGLLAANSDTLSNVPQATTVQNNVIEGFGRIFAKGFGIAQGCNHDNLYTHNEIYDGYSGAINIGALNCGVGGNSLTKNNVASFNLTYNLGQGVTNDFGCVYFNTSPFQAVPPSGNQALNNVCHDVTDAGIVDADGYGGQGIYLDNNTGLVLVQNNLVYRVSASAVAQTCGPQGVQGSQNTIKNNILAFAMQSIKQQGCTPAGAGNKLFDMTNNLVIFDVGNIQGGCFSCLNGNCASVLPATVNFESNLYCYAPSGSSCTLPTNRAAFFSSDDPAGQSGGCTRPTTYSNLAQWQSLAGEDAGSALKNPFSSAQSSNNDYSLSVSPGVGFVPFDPAQAGRTSNNIAAPAIAPTFPAQSYAPSQF